MTADTTALSWSRLSPKVTIASSTQLKSAVVVTGLSTMATIEKATLQQMWSEATKEFEERTSRVLNIHPPKTLEDVRKQIESQQAQYDSDERGLARQAKDASMNVLYCLKLLGGVAAQGASMVGWLPDVRSILKSWQGLQPS